MFHIIMPRFIFKVERWKWNKEYRVYVSNMGHFMDKHKKIIPILLDNGGYVVVRTAYGLIKGHRLVMKTWRPTVDMENLTIDHLDHNKRNNSVDNLEWVTKKENLARAQRDLAYFKARKNRKNKKSKEKKQLRVYTMEEFYYCVNDATFGSIAAAWEYAQNILEGQQKIDCTLCGLEKSFSLC